MNIKKILLFIQIVFCYAGAWGQKTLIYSEPIKLYNDAIELFTKEKYGSARQVFSEFIVVSADPVLKTNAEYYDALCALELGRDETPALLNQFATRHADDPKAELAMFHLGRYYFKQKDYRKALENLQKVDATYLTSAERNEFSFMSGFAYFQQKDYAKAKRFLAEVKDKKGRYQQAANYYYAYICFVEKNYDAALKGFYSVKDSKIYGPGIPVFIAQIYFAQKKYQQVVSFTDTIKDAKMLAQLQGVIGKSQFQMGNFAKAIPPLVNYHASADELTSEDHFELGYSYFKTKNFEKAFPELTKVSVGNDAMAQTANFVLANCFIGLDKKNNARIAFQNAAKFDFDRVIKEISIFNYAKISYEMGFQSEAVKALQAFIDNYPNSDYSDEAKALLSQLLLTTKNYKEAISLIESIKNKNKDLKSAYQKLTFYRGQELFQNGNYKEATDNFNKSLEVMEFDKKVKSYCFYYLAEIDFKNKKFDESIKNIKRFQAIPEAEKTIYYDVSYYNLGYCYFQKDDYANALNNFKKYLELDNFYNKTPDIYLDASLRSGDCNLIAKKYDAAVENYDYVIGKKGKSADYATYQKGMIRGLQNNLEEKIKVLKQVPLNYENSEYNDDALFEIANTRIIQSQFDNAIKAYQYLIDNYPRSIFISRCYLQIGLAYVNKDQPDLAIEQFKTVVEKYQGSDEAKEALDNIKNIYISRGEGDLYLAYIKKVTGADYSNSYQDSVTYEAALQRFKKGDCAQSIIDFENYLNKFPNGIFTIKSNYYLADCSYKEKQYDKALKAYEYLITSEKTEYLERAYRNSAWICYNNKNYQKALEYYSEFEKYANGKENILLSYLGQMRSANNLGENAKTKTAAKKIIDYDKAAVENKTEAYLYLGRIAMLEKDYNNANAYFSNVIKQTKNVMGAEAKFNIAEIEFNTNKFTACQKTVFELAENFSSYEYWVAKGYILLGDCYVAQNDYFQARATYNSVVENAEDAELVAIAKSRLTGIEGK